MRAPLLVFTVAIVGCSARMPGPSPAARPAPAAGAAGEPARPALRLPGDVRPVGYALELTIVPDQPTASGAIRIAARVERPTRVVWLHSLGLTISQARIAGAPVRVLPERDALIGLVAERELAPGPVAIELAFSAPIDATTSHGIYSELEGSGDRAERYVYTFFEPIDARRAFPHFDEPGFKVPWQLTFHVRRDHVALGNAAIVRETDEPGGMKRVELAPTPPLPSYLVAFVVGPFEVVDGGTAGASRTPIRFVIPQGRAGELGWARDVTPRVVAALEDYFAMPYPYGKLDVAVVPRYWGTMEHPGIVAMGQPLTLIRPDQATRERRQRYANILAHELAHYWFGDLVTMAWWDDTWLNESLGSWLDLIITDAVEPAWRVRDDRSEIAASAMAADETLATHPIRQPVTTADAIELSFDNEITYYKGSAIMRMFEALAGAARWRDFVRAYIRGHANATATAADFLAAARTHLGPEIEAGLRTFIELPGVPTISVTAACAAGASQLLIAQRRSLPAGATAPAPAPWHVPVCMRYGDASSSHEHCQLLTEERTAIPAAVCPTWILPNAGGNGYYRAPSPPAASRALLTSKVANLSAVERMMVITDARAAVDRGELGIDAILGLVPTIAADPDDRVALAALPAGSLGAEWLDDALFARSMRYYAATFGPRARALGWTRAASDSDERHQLRRNLVPAIARHDPALTAAAVRLADTWLASRRGVEDDLVGAVLAIAAYRGDARRFERILGAIDTARDRTEKSMLYAALAGMRDPALYRRALELTLDPARDLRDTQVILFGVFQREHRAVGLAFLEQNLDSILARMRADTVAGFLAGLAGGGCAPAERARLSALIVPRAAQVSGAAAVVQRALEQSDQCIAAAARNLPAIQAFLSRY